MVGQLRLTSTSKRLRARRAWRRLAKGIEKLETRDLLATVEVDETFRAFSFDYHGDFSGSTVVPQGWFGGQDYRDVFHGTESNGSGTVSFSNPTQGSGQIVGSGSGSGRDNCSSYEFEYSGSATITFNDGTLTRDALTRSFHYTDIDPDCISGGGDPFAISSTGTFNGQTWGAQVQWSQPLFPGSTSGSWTGQIEQIGVPPSDLRLNQATWSAPSGASTLDDVQVEVQMDVIGAHLRTAAFADAVTDVRMYWAKGTLLEEKLGEPLLDPQGIHWNTNRLTLTVEHLFPFSLPVDQAVQVTHLLVVVDEEGKVSEADETNNLISIEMPKLAVNVATHGFNPNPFGGWDAFRAPWFALAEDLNELPETASLLDHRVTTYVSQWESSKHFMEGFASLLVAKIAEANAAVAASQGDVARSEAARELAARLKLNTGLQAMLGSGPEAELAARKIVDDLRDDYLLDDVNLSRAFQSIHLVGHSRGAAVNARVSQLLSNLGYRVDQYTSLDGFSTDWPDDGGLLGDIDIAADSQATRKINYRVETDLADYVVDEIQRLGPNAFGGVAGLLRILTAQITGEPVNEITLNLDGATAAWLRGLDLRAPVRADFDSDPVIPNTNHVTITGAYAGNTTLLQDNCVGQQRSTSLAQMSQWPELCTATTGGASSGGSGEASPVPAYGSLPIGFVDGSFDGVGAYAETIADSQPFIFGDSFLDAWAGYTENPENVLRTLWTVTGDVRLVHAANQWMVEFHRSSTDAAIEQFVSFGGKAGNLEFDLDVLSETPGASVSIFADTQLLGTFSADTGAKSGHYQLSLEGREFAAVKILLTGTSSSPAVVRIDNLQFVPLGDQPPVAHSERIELSEGGTATLLADGRSSLLENDTDVDIPDDQLMVTRPIIGPFYGQLTMNSDGTFRYDHSGSETTRDRFVYRVTDASGGSATAVVVIDIAPVNDHTPQAADDTISLKRGASVSRLSNGASSLLDNDQDADMNQELLRIVTTPTVLPSHGVVELFEDGTFRYTHDGGPATSDRFTYTVVDSGGLSDTADVIITINLSSTWQNPRDPLDVNDDFAIVPIDALLIINELNVPEYRNASGKLPDERPPGALYYDVTGDGFATALDALVVINYLNRPGGAEGESTPRLLIANSPQLKDISSSSELRQLLFGSGSDLDEVLASCILEGQTRTRRQLLVTRI